MDKIYDDNYEYLDDITQDKPSKQTYKVHPYFVEMQFHNDYRDVITAFDCVVETGRPLFNRSNQPVKAVDVKKTEAKNLLRAFEISEKLGIAKILTPKIFSKTTQGFFMKKFSQFLNEQTPAEEGMNTTNIIHPTFLMCPPFNLYEIGRAHV